MGEVIVVGAGPAGLAAADVVSAAGHRVRIVDRMPSAGRKFLMAGRGGLNLTHSEPLDAFLTRYGEARERLEPLIRAYPPERLAAFATELGEATFVGSSGRVFPKSMKASPLLRAWLARLGRQGVIFQPGRRLTALAADLTCRFERPDGSVEDLPATAVVLALGGASWPRLGADGRWVPLLETCGIGVAPLTPSNCGATIQWSDHLRTRFAGTPLKRIALTAGEATARGEAMLTATGLEGGAVYALSPVIRDRLRAEADVRLTVDLRPDASVAEIATRLARPRGKLSTANWLRKALALTPAAVALLHEPAKGPLPADTDRLAALIKAVPLTVTGLAGLERAISTAGGVRWSEIDAHMMLKARPGVFVAGEMIDWEAPTGGYLLQAVFATGIAAGQGVLQQLVAPPQR